MAHARRLPKTVWRVLSMRVLIFHSTAPLRATMFRRLLLVVALAVFRADALSALHVAKYASPFRWSTPILGSDRPTCLHPLGAGVGDC